MQTIHKSLRMKDCPYWAGIPLILAGIFGVVYSALNFKVYHNDKKNSIIKMICCVLSVISIMLCITGSVFSGMHGHRISTYHDCQFEENQCNCVLSDDELAPLYTYQHVHTCKTVLSSIQFYLILQCALNSVSAGVCLWFIMFLWKSRYGSYDGVRSNKSPYHRKSSSRTRIESLERNDHLDISNPPSYHSNDNSETLNEPQS